MGLKGSRIIPLLKPENEARWRVGGYCRPILERRRLLDWEPQDWNPHFSLHYMNPLGFFHVIDPPNPYAAP